MPISFDKTSSNGDSSAAACPTFIAPGHRTRKNALDLVNRYVLSRANANDPNLAPLDSPDERRQEDAQQSCRTRPAQRTLRRGIGENARNFHDQK